MKKKDGKNGQRLVLSEASFKRVGEALADLIRKTRAKAVVFADTDGYPIVHRGRIRDLQLPALTALAAGSFSATAEMANLIGEKEKFRFLYHEGEKSNVYLSSIGDGHLIIVAFDSSVALGIVRIFTNKAKTRLEEMLNEIRRESKETTDFIDFEFKSLLSEELDKSFKLH